MIIDIEPLVLNPEHGFFHSYLGATIAGLLVVAMAIPLRKKIEWVSAHIVRLPQTATIRSMTLASLFGVWLHVFLDSFLYPEMKPFLPFDGNPFLGLVSPIVIYEVSFILFFPALVFYLLRICLRKVRNGKE